MRTINDAGRKLIEHWERLELEAYPDPVTQGDPWTIGYGHTGPDVHPGQQITLTEAVGLLEQDLAEAERLVERHVTAPLTDNQFSALVSPAFNIGPEFFHNRDGSPTHVLRHLNAGEYRAAADELLRWDRAKGRVVEGLLERREAERALFLTP